MEFRNGIVKRDAMTVHGGTCLKSQHIKASMDLCPKKKKVLGEQR
jgi:hypothetical protein